MLFLDTHCLVWLYAKELHHFSRSGLFRLEEESLFISPMASLELEYMFETARIKVPSGEITTYLADRLNLQIDPVSFLPIAERSLKIKWTRDPFDRLITAQAEFHGADLLSKDRTIREHYARAIW
jgi:PIN domain nuclease of toxin-antitoxin system